MTTQIQLYQIGEVVLGHLLRGLSERRSLAAINCVRHSNCTLHGILQSAQIAGSLTFEPNVRLSPVKVGGTTLQFDGAHAVDLFCRGENGRGLAFEAKLGLDRLSSADFNRRFLAGVSVTGHTPARVKGNMVSILNYRAIGALEPLDLRTTAPKAELADPWAMVTREAVCQRWLLQQPRLSETAHWFSFDRIAADFGGAVEFDDLVKQIVGDGFFGAWRIGLGRRRARLNAGSRQSTPD